MEVSKGSFSRLTTQRSTDEFIELINVDTTNQSPVILSLCTGLLRGLERGVEHSLQQRLHVAAYVEIEAFVIENLLCEMEAGVLAPAPVWTDLKTFPYREFHGKIHGIIGGYPCQPFSVAGKQKGTEDPRHLWPFIKTGIAATQPVFCFFENVRGHLKLGFEQVYTDLCGLGYSVRFGIYSAEEVGAPHRRERLFILAIREDQMEHSTEQGLQKSRSSGIGESSKEVSQRMDNRFEQPGNELADSIGEGLQGHAGDEYREGRKSIRESGSITESRYDDPEWNPVEYRWPSRPGQPQHEWEAPRVAQSGMGCSTYGYNFREDLLRGLGNGVVWQTAAFAFSDLLSKF